MKYLIIGLLVIVLIFTPTPYNLIAWLLICAILIYRVAKLW